MERVAVGEGVSEGWMGKRKRTERRSGQARDAWLESGQAHMRPSTLAHSTERLPHRAAGSTCSSCSTFSSAGEKNSAAFQSIVRQEDAGIGMASDFKGDSNNCKKKNS